MDLQLLTQKLIYNYKFSEMQKVSDKLIANCTMHNTW